MNRVIFGISFLLLIGCADQERQVTEKIDENNQSEVDAGELTPEMIITESYNYHGCEHINSASISFDFRAFHFEYLHTDTGLVRSREFEDTLGRTIKDIWSRTKLERFVNGQKEEILDEKREAYKNSINSVFYFAFLPKSLRDPAVNTTYIDTSRIKGKDYHKIKVTFDEEGGGEDHEDVFMYWFDVEDYSMDYLAYSYLTNGGGMRFRSIKDRKEIDGIVLQDYFNYAPPKNSKLESLDKLFDQDELEQVSVIELENIKIDGE